MYKRVLIVGLLALFFSACFENMYTIKIPTSEVNKKVEEKFPVSKELKYGTLTISNPKILSSSGDDRISMGANLKFENKILGNIKGIIYISGNIVYKNKSKEFFLVNPKIDDLKLLNNNILMALNDTLKQKIFNITSQIFKKLPIYKLDGKDFKGTIAQRMIQKIEVEKDIILVTLGL
jgi:hypothetical protein